jgi:two-component system, response regulator
MILLVEDNPDDAALTLRALKNNGIANDVVHVSDGVEALEFLRGEGGFADRDPRMLPELVLLDLNLPRMNGLDVLRELRSDANTHRLPVVILTTSVEESDMASGYDLGVNSYVRKPVDFHEFVDAVRTLGTYWLLVNQGPPRITGQGR